MAKEQKEIDETPSFVLKDIKRGVVWHEQFKSREMAQGCIDYHQSIGENGNWEIIEVGTKTA